MLSDSPKVEEAGSFFNITKHLKSFDNLNKDDFLFIYFSGHKSRYDNNEKKDEIFLPQDWNINQLTKDYLKNFLIKYNCRTFVMFDCCNKKGIVILNIIITQKMELVENLKLNDEKNDIILLTSGGINKNSYETFLESNLINGEKINFMVN